MENRAAVLHGVHDIRVEEVAVPEPGPKEVLVEIRRVGVCGSDVHMYEDGGIGPYVVNEPLIIGHEPMGVVVALGEGASRRRVGERVALEPGVPCGRCRQCRAGRYNLCPDVRFFAAPALGDKPAVDGAFAKYVAIHEDFAHPLPDEMSDEAGALMEPLSVGIWACRKAGVAAGDRVLVTGAGPIGLMALQAALAFGALEVTVTDVASERLLLAEKLGAGRTVNVSREPLHETGLEVDRFIECSGNLKALRDGIFQVRPAGVAVKVGAGPYEEGVVPLAFLQNNEVWLTGTFRFANTYPTAIGLAASHRVNVGAMITGCFSLDDVEEAILAGRRDPGNVKSVVRLDT